MGRIRRPQNPERLALTFGPNEYDPEPIERTVILPPNFPYMELRALGAMLGTDGLFVSGENVIRPEFGRSGRSHLTGDTTGLGS